MFILPTDPNGYYRVLLTLPDKGEKKDPTLAELEGLARHKLPGLTLHDPLWLNRYRTQHRIATNYRAGRAFVAGDAAHVWVPIGGRA